MLRWSATCVVAALAINAAARSDTGTRLAAAPIAEVAALLDQAALALQGTTNARRTHIAMIERLSDFRDDEPVRAMGRGVGLLWITLIEPSGEKKTFQCTATLITRDTVLTNHHCISGAKAGTSVRLELWLEHVVDAAARYSIDPVPIEQDAVLDYAVLRIAQADRSRTPVLPSIRVRAALPGERLIIIHHSDGAPLQITRAQCRVDSVVPFRANELLHTCATRPGSSGALVFAERDGAVVGLHHSIRRLQDRVPGIATPVSALVEKSPLLRSIMQSVAAALPR